MDFKSSYHLQPCRLPKQDAKERQLGVTTTNGLQVLLPPVAVLITQTGHWEGISWRSRLQMAFKSSYHLQRHRLPKLDGGGASVTGHDYIWSSSLPTTYSHASYPSWMLEGRKLGVMTPIWPSNDPSRG